VLRRGVRSGGREGGGAGDGDQVDDVRPTLARRDPEPGHQGARAPHAAEVVDLHHALDAVEVDDEEVATRRDAGVVHEQVHGRMAHEDPRGECLDGVTVGDVAQLDLAVDLLGERAQPVLTAGDEHAAPPALREAPRDRLADACRGAGYDRDLLLRLLGGCGSGGGHQPGKLQVATCRRPPRESLMPV